MNHKENDPVRNQVGNTVKAVETSRNDTPTEQQYDGSPLRLTAGTSETLIKTPTKTTLNSVARVPNTSTDEEKYKNKLSNAEFEAALGRYTIVHAKKPPASDSNSDNKQSFNTPKAKSRRYKRRYNGFICRFNNMKCIAIHYRGMAIHHI